MGLTFPMDDGGAPVNFYGPYIGGSFGTLTTGESLTTSAAIGYNFQPMDNLLVGLEFAGRLYNDADYSYKRPTSNDDYALHGKIGTTFDRFAVYGVAGAGFDSKQRAAVYEVGAGAEVGLSSHTALFAQLLASAPFTSLPTTFHVEGGVRYHFDAFVPYQDDNGDYPYPDGIAGVAGVADALGVSEVRLGGAVSNIELSPHRLPFAPYLPSFSKARYDTVTADVLFDSPWLISWAGAPRPYVGASVNVGGYESSAHAGLNWHFDLANTPLFAELGGGIAVHNGYLDNAPAGFRNLGCQVLTEWQYGLGANINDHVTVTAQYQHISGSFFGCNPNDGVNNFGVEMGWKF